MKNLNLERLWEICNRLSYEQLKLEEEKDIYVSLLGNSSNYCGDMLFDSFLNYYSFKVDGEHIVVFNTDPIPYESWNNDDVSYFPSVLLSFSDEKLKRWVETEIELQLAKQERDKIQEKEDIKRQIESLQKRLNN
jgi:hypothetical protein